MSASSTLEFPIPVLRPGELHPIAPGVYWLRMRLPYRLNHVNLWILEDGDALTVVDTGMNMPESRETWEAVLGGRFAGRPITRVICTHYHSDHIGLAAWLCARSGAPLAMSRIEWATARFLSIDHSPELMAAQRAFYRGLGYEMDWLDRLDAVGNAYATKVVAVPPVFHRLKHDDVLSIGGRDWRIVLAAGHSPGMACLYAESDRLLIAGDHILPSITPNVSIYPSEPDADPLSEYLASFRPFRALSEDALVLASHGRPFRGLHARIDEIEAHHSERLERLLGACRTPLTVVDMLAVLFAAGLTDHERVIASGEALAHVRYLLGKGLMRENRSDADVLRFETI